MEYKIFGPGEIPPEEFRGQVSDFLKLDDAQRNTIAEAFLQRDFDPFSSTLPPIAVASSLLPEQFGRAVQLIRNLLGSWQDYGLALTDIERDLVLLGYAQPEIETITSFLSRLTHVRGRVRESQNLRMQQLDGLPTIDNMNLICDARAVFGGFPLGSERAPDSYKSLLSLTPIVIMEIISSDNYGQRQRAAFQMTEEEFEGLRRMIARAHEQLAILKERIETTKTPTV